LGESREAHKYTSDCAAASWRCSRRRARSGCKLNARRNRSMQS
jgi:hypothetical protein